MKIGNLSLLALMVFAVPAISDEVYIWVDEDGTVHYSDSPPPDVQSEVQDLQVDEPGEPDSGELRRRQSLEQANIDATQRIERQRAAAETRRIDAEARQEREQDCLDARIRHEILAEPRRRVYRDTDGNPRIVWQADTYTGTREYISDAERPAAISRARAEVAELCDRPADPDAQAAARETWIKSEKCTAAKADLEQLLQAQSRSSASDIEKQRRLIEFYCTDVAR